MLGRSSRLHSNHTIIMIECDLKLEIQPTKPGGEHVSPGRQLKRSCLAVGHERSTIGNCFSYLPDSTVTHFGRAPSEVRLSNEFRVVREDVC